MFLRPMRPAVDAASRLLRFKTFRTPGSTRALPRTMNKKTVFLQVLDSVHGVQKEIRHIVIRSRDGWF